MKIDTLTQEIRQAGCAGFCYEQTGRPRFRDRVTFYRDGRVLFERFCYGEAAGKACSMWAAAVDEQGRILWDYDSCSYTGKSEAPVQITGARRGGLVLDGKPALWERVETLKTDKEHGYGALKILWLRLRGM